MGAHICLFALFATAIFATPVVEEDQSDITIPSTHGYLIVEEGDVYLYVEEGDEDIYLYYESFTQDDEIVIAFDDPTGGGVAGISVTIEEDADGFCNKVTVMDLEFEEEDVWLEDSGTTIEDYVVALDAKAPQLCVVQITLTAGDETAVGDVTTDGAIALLESGILHLTQLLVMVIPIFHQKLLLISLPLNLSSLIWELLKMVMKICLVTTDSTCGTVSGGVKVMKTT